jgi:hypothetical protein
LAETEKLKIYHLIDKLIFLVLTVPVFTTTTERAFSTMTRKKARRGEGRIVKEYSSLLDRNGKEKKNGNENHWCVYTNTRTVTHLKSSFDDDDDEARRLPI